MRQSEVIHTCDPNRKEKEVRRFVLNSIVADVCKYDETRGVRSGKGSAG